MNYQNSWIITCGVCCIYPALMFAAGAWVAKNGARIDWKNINWKFWKRDR